MASKYKFPKPKNKIIEIIWKDGEGYVGLARDEKKVYLHVWDGISKQPNGIYIFDREK